RLGRARPCSADRPHSRADRGRSPEASRRPRKARPFRTPRRSRCRALSVARPRAGRGTLPAWTVTVREASAHFPVRDFEAGGPRPAKASCSESFQPPCARAGFVSERTSHDSGFILVPGGAHIGAHGPPFRACTDLAVHGSRTVRLLTCERYWQFWCPREGLSGPAPK